MSSWAKLLCRILDSSLWSEASSTRVVWITLLAMADRYGRVMGSESGIAHRARVSAEETKTALNIFQKPDPDSTTPDNAGVRIERIDGGWKLLNFEKVRNETQAEERREYVAAKVAEHRARKTGAATNGLPARERFTKPEFSEMELYAQKIGLDLSEVPRYQNYYESNGWRVGRNPMKDWQAAMRNWKSNCNKKTYEHRASSPPQHVDRSIGTANEGMAAKYKDLVIVDGRVVGRQRPADNKAG